MYQVIFAEQAMAELNKLAKLTQLAALDPLSNLRQTDLDHPREPLGKFARFGQELFRLRSGELRFYFETADHETLRVLYILPEHSFEDFLLRNKLPVSEQQLVEQHSQFWKYLEGLTKR